MMRGTYANIRIRNEMAPELEGGFTRRIGEDKPLPIYEARHALPRREPPTGSGRRERIRHRLLPRLGSQGHTTAQHPRGLIAESFECIHRSNLVGMDVVPLQFPNGTSRQSLGLTGNETVTIRDLAYDLRPRQGITTVFTQTDGPAQETALLCRIDTDTEIDYMCHDGIPHYVLRQFSEAG